MRFVDREALMNKFRAALGMLLGILVMAACDFGGDGRSSVDIEWHRQSLMTTHLARWLAAAPTESGVFRTTFDRRWQAQPKTGSDLTGQSRLVYAMLIGYEVSGDKRYLEAATRGADVLLARFHDPIYGGFFKRVADDGKVLDESKHTYGHAFALLALSHMYRVSRDERYRDAALNTWREIDRGLRDEAGGVRPSAPRNFAATTAKRTQNPIMHLFEALLALSEATQDPEALAGAASVGNFVVHKLLQKMPDGSANIPEWYDENWKPLRTREEGGFIDLGHQFEWIHLFLSAEAQGLGSVFPAASSRILEYALKVGYDEVEGGAFFRASPDGSVDRSKYWWQQAECLRALVAAAVATKRRDLWRRYEQTLDLIREDFIDQENGGWRFGDRRLCERGACPDTQPDPYHMAGMHWAAMRAATKKP